MVFSSSRPRRTTVSRHMSSRYGISAASDGTVGCRSQSTTEDTSLHLQQQVLALHLYLEHLQIRLRRRAQRLAGLHIEPSRVQRALDATVLQPAVGQQRVLV